MRAKDRPLWHDLISRIADYEAHVNRLPSLASGGRRNCLTEQIIESVRRKRFLTHIATTTATDNQLDPSNPLFDPLRAAANFAAKADQAEAIWLVFLATLCAKTRRGKFERARRIYEGQPIGTWTWARLVHDVNGFRRWLTENEVELSAIPGGCGNHRKYESISGSSSSGAGATVESFVHWSESQGGSEMILERARQRAHGDAREAFDCLFNEMRVLRFGRTGKFDFLSTIGLLGIADLEPKFAYLSGSSGPLSGARLLFYNDRNARVHPAALEPRLSELDEYLKVGMKVIEDALCNWQKNPNRFSPFRG